MSAGVQKGAQKRHQKRMGVYQGHSSTGAQRRHSKSTVSSENKFVLDLFAT